MAKQKFKVWQVGWEDEVHEVEADLEGRECPACEFVGDLPVDVPTEGLDPITGRYAIRDKLDAIADRLAARKEG